MPWPKMAAGVGKTVVPTVGRSSPRSPAAHPSAADRSRRAPVHRGNRATDPWHTVYTVGRPLITPPPNERIVVYVVIITFV